jgi:hypothetical protein
MQVIVNILAIVAVVAVFIFVILSLLVTNPVLKQSELPDRHEIVVLSHETISQYNGVSTDGFIVKINNNFFFLVESRSGSRTSVTMQPLSYDESARFK